MLKRGIRSRKRASACLVMTGSRTTTTAQSATPAGTMSFKRSNQEPTHCLANGTALHRRSREPVEHVQVTATRYTRGRKQPVQAGAGQTDDLGEYRIFGLEASKYYLSATYRQPAMMSTQDRTVGAAADEGYAPTFYPGTNDPAGA